MVAWLIHVQNKQNNFLFFTAYLVNIQDVFILLSKIQF